MKKILLFKRNSRLCCILFLQLVFLPAFAFQQSNFITGTISDATGTLPGVNITNQRTMITTQSDLNGAYEIEAQVGDALLFTFMGYKTQIAEVGEMNRIDIQLEVDSTVIDEVVINAGYYTVKDRERTGSISRITAKDIEKQSVLNPLEALQGRMTGVDIVQTSGVAGSGFDVKIRGVNSIMAGNSPLYIIDGVPYDSQTLGSRNSSLTIIPNGNISPLNAINPHSIESIEVLKDADATAIYGSRGANGVVLITTKKGKVGKTTLNIGSSTGIANSTQTREILNTEQYLEMRREAFANDGITTYPANAHDVNGTWDENRYTDWQKVLIGNTVYTNQVQGSLTGGGEGTQYLLSGMVQNETTVFPGDFKYNRITLNSNLQHQSYDKRFRLTFSSGYTLEKNHLPINDLTTNSVKLSPNAPELYDEAGELNWENSTWTNPLAQLEGKYLNKSNNLIFNNVLNYRLFDDVELKLNTGYNYARLEDTRAIPHTIYNPAFGLNSGNASQSYMHRGSRNSIIVEPQVNWSKELEDHSLDLLFGLTYQSQKNEVLTLLGNGYSNNSFLGSLSAANNLRIIDENSQEYNYQSVFARINYNYDKKIYLNVTGRRDGSSRFSTGNRFGNFGALGGSWIFSEDLKLDWLSLGKLRGSYGIAGNDQIGDYQYLQTYIISDYPYGGNVGLLPSRLYNPNFRWEENVKKEVAIDLGFFDRSVELTTAYYNNRSSNQLINYALPNTTGFGSIQSNMNALVENSGWEFELRSTLLQRNNLKWEGSINLSLPSNKLLAFPGLEESSYANQYVIGEPISIFKLYNLKGVNPETGVFEFEDYNGDGLITAADDRQYIADLTPKFYGGLSNSVSYKNWSLDIFFQFMQKKGVNEFYGSSVAGTMFNQSVSVLDRWQSPGDEAVMQRFTSGGNGEAVLAYSQFVQSSGIISDASFVRLKSLMLSYNINMGKTGNSSFRIYMQGQNLLTFTRYKGGDPEQGIGYVPPLKRITVGIQLQL